MNTKQTLLAVSVALILSGQAHAETELKKTSIETKKETKNKVISSDIIDQEMTGSDSDLTRYISGIDVSNVGNRFGGNGFNIRGMEADAVAITVDGLSQGESLDPPTFSRYGMFSSTRNSVELESMKAVEIIKGANSITAGSGALGGAVMYTTKDASDFLDSTPDALGGSMKVGYDGRSNEKLINVAVAKRFNDFEALAILTAREGNETEAHTDGLNTEDFTRGLSDPLDKSQRNVLIKLSYDISDNKEIGFVLEDYRKENDGQSPSRQSNTYSNFTFDDESSRDRIGVFFDWQANNDFFDDLSINIDQQEIYSSGITAFEFTTSSSILRMEDRNYNQDMFNASVDLTKLFINDLGQHDINYGISTSKNTVVNSLQDIRFNGITTDTGLLDGYPIIDPSWVPETDSKSIAIYARDEIALNDKLTVSIGARYDKTSYEPKVDDTFTDISGTAVNDSEFSAVSSQLSASYKLNENNTIFASVNRAFKAPTTQQLYLNADGTSTFVDAVRTVNPDTGSITYEATGLTETDLDSVSNPNLDAETATNIELSYTWSNDNASINITAFNSKYDNLIINQVQTNTFDIPITQGSSSVFNPFCSEAVITDACYSVSTVTGDEWDLAINAGEVTVKGIEIDAQWQINPQWSTSFSYSHAQGEYDKTIEGVADKGDELESITPDNAVLGLNYLSSNKDWGVSTRARFIDEKEYDETFDAIFYSDSASVVDLTAFYNITENLVVRGGVYNLFDENYSLWQSVKNVRQGSGGFFGGVDATFETNSNGNDIVTASDGIGRYSESGRSLTININYAF